MSVNSLTRLSAATLLLLAASPLLMAADAKNGKVIFEQRCGICHAVTGATGGPVVGPSMVGIVGRKAATVEGFALYSQALKTSGLTWTPKTLDEFLAMPMQKVPGTTMPMMIADAKERGDVIAYMSTLKK
jgi:cytochrome c